jgi:hypothetical protein
LGGMTYLAMGPLATLTDPLILNDGQGFGDHTRLL